MTRHKTHITALRAKLQRIGATDREVERWARSIGRKVSANTIRNFRSGAHSTRSDHIDLIEQFIESRENEAAA